MREPRLGLGLARMAVWLMLAAHGLVAFALAAAPAVAAEGERPEPAMRFVVVRGEAKGCDPICPEWISAEGMIEGGTASRFKKFLRKLGDRRLPIVIQSPGGNVEAALAMARLIRARGLQVGVGRTIFTSCSPETEGCAAEKNGGYTGYAISIDAYCNSACPMVLAGGVMRLVGERAFLGVHQITTVLVKENILYRTKTRVVRGKKVVTKEIVRRERAGTTTTTKMGKALRRNLQAFFKEMGVDPGLLEPIEATPASGIRILTPSEQFAYGLVTAPWSIDTLLDPQVCSGSPTPSLCRKLPAPPVIRIVRSRQCKLHCSEWISLEGDIDGAALPQLQEALHSLGGPRPIVLSSRGGDIESALELGRFIRKQGLTVSIGRTIPSKCRSGVAACGEKADYEFQVGSVDTATAKPFCTGVCPYVLGGGIERIVGDAVSVDFDAVASLPRSSSLPRKKRVKSEALLSAYLAEMGFDPKLLEMIPTSSGGGSVRVPGRELRRMQLVTGSQRVEDCGRSPLPTHCRKVPEPPRIRMVRSGDTYCAPYCGEWISLEGDIDDSALPLLREALKIPGSPRRIVLSSRGGDIESALALGRFIREQGLTVVIGWTVITECRTGSTASRQRCNESAGYDFRVGRVRTVSEEPLCTNVCPFVLAGGVERIVPAAVAVHLDSLSSLRPAPGGGETGKRTETAIHALLSAYLEEMGVQPNLLKAAPVARAGSVKLSEWRIRRMRLDTR